MGSAPTTEALEYVGADAHIRPFLDSLVFRVDVGIDPYEGYDRMHKGG